MSVQKYFKNVSKYPPLSKTEEKELFKKAKKGDRSAYETIIKSNLRFVVSIAKNYLNRGLPLEDLISEGNLGLIKAYDHFNCEKNYKFITYAVWWIRQSIISAINEYGSIIRTPVNKINSLSAINKLKIKQEQTLGQEVSMNELLDSIQIDTNTKLFILNLSSPISLEDKNIDTGQELKNTVENDNADLPEALLENMSIELQALLDELPENEKDIINMYYGIGYDRPYTLTEIGEKFNLTRERIRQIKKQILSKLKNTINNSKNWD